MSFLRLLLVCMLVVSLLLISNILPQWRQIFVFFRWLRRIWLLKWKPTDCFRQHSEPRFVTLKNSRMYCVEVEEPTILVGRTHVVALEHSFHFRVGAPRDRQLQPPGKETWRLVERTFCSLPTSLFFSFTPSKQTNAVHSPPQDAPGPPNRGWLAYWLTDWLTDLLTDWLTD